MRCEAAELLDRDHVRVAFSGVALTTGYGFFGDKTGMDQWYFQFKNCNHTKDQMPWDWSYDPQMVVINLGTNDSKDGKRPTAAEFAVTYAKFIRAIRAHLPKAKIVAMRPFGGFEAGGIRQAVASLAVTDSHIHYVDTEGWLEKADFVDGIHPSVTGHALGGQDPSGRIPAVPGGRRGRLRALRRPGHTIAGGNTFATSAPGRRAGGRVRLSDRKAR